MSVVCICWLIVKNRVKMQGMKNIKFVNAQQAKQIYCFKNNKERLFKIKASVWYSIRSTYKRGQNMFK